MGEPEWAAMTPKAPLELLDEEWWDAGRAATRGMMEKRAENIILNER
jgi:hypothetical protein